jgi:hypothetical protein
LYMACGSKLNSLLVSATLGFLDSILEQSSIHSLQMPAPGATTSLMTCS